MSINSSLSHLFYYCFDASSSVSLFNAFIVTKILLCGPLSIIVFYLGHQRWQQQRSTRTTTHSDIFTYHVAAMELITCVMCIFYFSGIYTDIIMAKVTLYVATMSLPGEMWFHCLTCIERYLAVVHPIVYRSLKQSNGVKIRNISIGYVWMLCFTWVTLVALNAPNFPVIPFFFSFVFSLVVVTFCSLSVLCVLIRPGPGDAGGDEKRLHQAKQRAFYTVMAISAVLWLWFVGVLVCYGLELLALFSHNDGCMVIVFGLWFTVPSCVVSPLLFLYRTGKLQCCQLRNE